MIGPLRYPSSLHLAVQRAVAVAVADVKARSPRSEGPEHEIVFCPVDHTHRAPTVGLLYAEVGDEGGE